MTHFYDRYGQPISAERWMVLFEDFERRVVTQTRVSGFLVSTVWLGLDHSFGDGPPLIFETMVFEDGDSEHEPTSGLHKYRDLQARRYASLSQAQAGHDAMVAELALLVTSLETTPKSR